MPDYVISLFLLLPPPEDVPPEYLELATRFHRLVVHRAHQHSMPEAASAASERSESAGSTDNFIWVERWKDAELLRHAYAKAAGARYSSYAESLREYRSGMTANKFLQLSAELEVLRAKWEPSSITSITGLEPTDDMSLAHNEFVWEGLMGLDRLAYLFAYDNLEEVKVGVLRNNLA
ncbi:hypothetical protein SeLEV6574_g05952 [Synchytrium endobioticum]|uniref:ABM domain-containing protein n=1 Tax=Synchytrium endobioticum TaxID=286115 RepID=A0A507CRE5_9FUNG|nr:hypothetical protein SeLEV6574_g05952 [Synchytrium endobioticum]